MSKFNVGDKVRYVGYEHGEHPAFYPVRGTMGKIVAVDEDDIDCVVQWPKNSTSKDDCHWCILEDLEKVVEKTENEMTNEEIWNFLKNKMGKNGLISKASIINTHADDYPNNEMKIIKVYYESDVTNAIAIAYRSGYERAMKGRPFKIGEKKKKGGHWEPIDPNNLPKEGTRVRYARECTSYGNIMVKLGDEGVVEMDGVYDPIWFGVKFDNPRSWMKWLCFDEEEDCLDMWVEDDK